jgi:hypothetical protein
VALFTPDSSALALHINAEKTLSLMPRAVHHSRKVINDDFENSLEQVYVWIWLLEQQNPLSPDVAVRQRRFIFNYGRSYLERKEAIAVLCRSFL